MLMVCGAAISKTRPYPGFIKYQSPSLWKRMGQVRSKRDLRDNIASKVGEHSFESMRYSRNNLLELYSRMLKDEESAIEITAGLGLELEELIYLSGSTKASKKLQKIYDKAQELLLEGKTEFDETEFFRAPVPSGEDKKILSDWEVKTPEKKAGKSSEKPEIPDTRTSQGEQKTLNSGFDILLEVPREITNSGNNTADTIIPRGLSSGTLTPDSLTPGILTPEKYREGTEGSVLILDSFTPRLVTPDNPEIKDSFSLPESFKRETFPGSETLESTLSPGTSKPKETANPCSVIKNVPDKPEDSEAEVSETPKKAELKTQKTLFDF